MSQLYRGQNSLLLGYRPVFAAAALLFLLFPPMIAAMFLYYPISGDISFGPETRFRFSPDGKSVVFRTPDELSVVLIYSVPASGGSIPVLLGKQDFFVRELRISPDSRWVVFVSSEPWLKSVPLAGGTAVTLWNSGVIDLQISADSKFVVFKTWGEAGFDFVDLFVVPIAGGEVRQLNEIVGGGEGVVNFAISPDGRTVVYSTLEDDGRAKLVSVPIKGGVRQDLTAGLGAALDYPIDFRITPDSSAVVFRAIVSGEGNSLLAVPIGGGEPRLLAGPFSGQRAVTWFEPTSDGHSVLYTLLDRSVSVDWVVLTSIPVQGGAPTKLAEANSIFAIRHTDNYVAYRTGSAQIINDYIVARSGGPARHVGGPFFCPVYRVPTCTDWQFEFTPDGRYLLFSARENDVMHLYSTQTAGGPTRLLVAIPDDFPALDFQIAGSSKYVFFFGATAAGNSETLLSVSPEGGPPEPVVPPPAEFSGNYWGVPQFQASPIGSDVLLGARWPGEEEHKLYVASPHIELLYDSYLPLAIRGR